MSWKRFSFRIPSAFVWASSSTRASSGSRAMTASTSMSSTSSPPWLTSQPRHVLEPLGERRGLGPVVRLQVADDDVTAASFACRPSSSIR